MVLLWNLSPNQAYVLLNKPAYDDSEPQSKPLCREWEGELHGAQ